MEIERLLRDTLDLERMDGEPSLGLEERVMLALPDRRGRRRSTYAAAFLAAAAVMALVAVLVPWYVGRPSAVQGGPSASSRDPATITPEPTATAVPLAHARKWGLSFDYPAAWQVSDAPALPAVSSPSLPPGVSLESLYEHQVLGYVGTETPQTDCTQAVTNVMNFGGPGMLQRRFCTSIWSLRPGDVSIRVQHGYVNGTPLVGGQPLLGTTETTVGGLPALFERNGGASVPVTPVGPGYGGDPTFESATGADVILTWYLPGNEAQPINPNNVGPPYRITAVLRGPNTAALEAQVRAVIASLEYDPAVIPLPTDPVELAALAKTALAAALDSLHQSSPGSFSCFPRTAGTVTGILTVTPMTWKLGKPLPVTCTLAIAPNAMQSWTITLTISWSAAADRRAGTWTEVRYTTSDGRTWGNGEAPTDNFPYEVGSGQPG
ncbi:MAG TPA: hypothetical protein VF349_02750 [Candidatus Limnocylindrales bacterium]